MTGKQLRASVATLGLLVVLDEEQEHAFIPAANRALKQITQELPNIGQVQIAHLPITPAVYDCAVRSHVGGENHTYKLDGARAFAFEVFGYGRIIIKDKSGHEKQIEVGDAKTFRFYRYLLADLTDENAHAFDNPADLTLSFVGSTASDVRYMYRNVALYTEIVSSDAEEIKKYGERTEYDLAEICGDRFGGIAGDVFTDDDCERDPDVRIEYDSIVSLRTDAPGIYKVPVYLIPRKITKDRLDQEIDLNPRYSHLLELLTAYYLWTIDNPGQAQQYLAMYQSELLTIRQKRRLGHVYTTRSKQNGW